MLRRSTETPHIIELVVSRKKSSQTIFWANSNDQPAEVTLNQMVFFLRDFPQVSLIQV